MASSATNKPIGNSMWADEDEDEDFWQEMEVVKKEDPANGLDEDEDFWQEMEVVKKEDPANGLDEEDQKKYHYVSPKKTLSTAAGNATGVYEDIDYRGREWRSKTKQAQRDENDYTRLRLDEDDDSEEIHLRTKFLFDEDKAMTPLNQMQATKDLLTEAQRIAYVGVCYLTCREMVIGLKKVGRKELAGAVKGMELWSLKIMGRLYFHMELALPEQKMIETLAEHGVSAMDLVPTLMTTHTVANPEYDPVEAKKAEEERTAAEADTGPQGDEDDDDENTIHVQSKPVFNLNDISEPSNARTRSSVRLQTTANVLEPSTPIEVPGVSTHLSNTDTHVTLDVRWTVLCDLFLTLIADSVYDARSRVLLENVAAKLGLGWSEVIRFEKRVTDALEIEEGADSLESREAINGRIKSSKRRRYVMMGLATLGGGLVMGISAGLLAPVIGAGIGAAFATIGVSGGTSILVSAGGAAVITTTGALTGSGIAGRGMARRTQNVTSFEILPMHNNKRVNCILTIPGFMTNIDDDVRLPFSVLDPIVGDVFSVRWEPEMMGETGNALRILSTEVLSQVSTTVLQYTVLTALMSALQWPLLLTKLGYLIDNPWSNALDRAKAAGLVLADVLMARSLGVRPITLIGFSLGARMIFYCLVELAKHKAFGIVQDVFLLGATVTAPARTWAECRSVVAGRFVNGFARNDWILGYLFRATSGGLNTVAGLRPVDNVPALENVDLTDKIAGHSSYRAYMPLILDQLGFPVSADYFDEPEEMMTVDREVVREAEEDAKANKRFSLFSGRGKETTKPRISRPPGPESLASQRRSSSASTSTAVDEDDELPERLSFDAQEKAEVQVGPAPLPPSAKGKGEQSKLSARAGFDLKAISAALAQAKESSNGNELESAVPPPVPPLPSYARAHTMPMPDRTTESQEFKVPSSPTTPTAPYQKPFFSGSDTSVNRTADVDEELARRFEATRITDAPKVEEDRHVFSNPPSASPYGGSRQYAARRESLNVAPQDTGSWGSPFDTPTPTLSFGGADGSIWTPGTGSTGRFDNGKETPATASSRFGFTQNQNEGFYKAPSYNVFQKPSGTGYSFGDSSGGFKSHLGSNPVAGSSTISFGAEDGTISLGPTPLKKDVWAPKPIAGGTKRPAYTVNPWDS